MPKTEKYNLFLDDIRTLEMAYAANPKLEAVLSQYPIVVVKNAAQFLKAVFQKGVPQIVSFDHDIGDFFYEDGIKKERTGDTCAQWLCQYCLDHNLPLPNYTIHSDNTVGRANITKTFKFYEKHLR